MFNYETFLEQKNQKNNQELPKGNHRLSITSEIKINTTNDSEITNENKNKNQPVISEYDIKKLTDEYHKKSEELNDLVKQYNELRKQLNKKKSLLNDNKKEYLIEKENNMNLQKLILQLINKNN
jgi:hypothetical protein